VKKSYNIYTDGSKNEEDHTGSGWAITINNSVIASDNHYLGCIASVFQAEIHAIINACDNMSDSKKPPQFNKISIFSDSLASINALSNDDTKNNLVLECKKSINKLQLKFEVSIFWIKGHTNHCGNELADMLAKLGTTPTPIVEPVLGISNTYLNKQIHEDANAKWQDQWDSNPEMYAATKTFVKKINTDITYRKGMLSLKRPVLHNLVAWITGHTSLRYMLSKYYPHMLNHCRRCAADSETAFHALMECDSTILKRHEYLGEHLGIYFNPDSNIINHKARKKHWSPSNKELDLSFIDQLSKMIKSTAPLFEKE
jgi:ribonuclease HI